MATEAFRCADSAEARDEPLYGTASFVRTWLLLEQPGSWGPNALLQSGLSERIAQELARRTKSAGIRIILIRRGVRSASSRRQCYFARTDEIDPYLSHLALDSLDDLLDLDLSPLREGGSIEGSAERGTPLFLVCTHGRHDACCSIRGNEVSRVACAEPEVDAWECSHIGGDRFAANLVCFPHGVYYGRVGPRDVVSLMHSYGEGTVSLDHYRGRCTYPFAVQAAEYFVRRETETTAVGAIWLLGSKRGGDELTATFALSDRRQAVVTVRVGELSGTHRLTCKSSRALPIPRYDLVSCVIVPR